MAIASSGKIIYHKETAPHVFVVRIGLDGPFDFYPGQFCMLGLEIGGQEVKRPYSIASAKNEKAYLEFCYVMHADGALSRYLAKKVKGDEVIVQGPYGKFFMDNPVPGKDTVFVAGGTGIAPLISMIRCIDFSRTSKDVWLFFGFKTGEFFLYKDELEALEKKHPNFHLIPSISRDDPSWQGRRGYIQTHLELAGSPSGKQVYLCGPSRFTVDVVARLKALGFASEDIHYEGW
ncbi:FAD-dependent oxidoreductase [Candidatus Woesearchaeota archaeon]|nr:FAD-dependent oxidoreductase [Candidatus Woesearchaeota archaeon]